jgi:hypothetical protein
MVVTWLQVVTPIVTDSYATGYATNRQLLLGEAKMTYYNLNDFYNESASPFYYGEIPLGYIDGQAIYEGDDCWLCCLLDEKYDYSDDLPF